jgi:hypothetical protein
MTFRIRDVTQIAIRNSRLERSHLAIELDGGLVRVSVRRVYALRSRWTVPVAELAVRTVRHKVLDPLDRGRAARLIPDLTPVEKAWAGNFEVLFAVSQDLKVLRWSRLARSEHRRRTAGLTAIVLIDGFSVRVEDAESALSSFVAAGARRTASREAWFGIQI